MDEREFGKLINKVMSICIKYRTRALDQEECVDQLRDLINRLKQEKEG